ncbi:lipoyl protein ligase domain-containing protein [Thalassovita taeanensis]|uniref:Lipoate-protein ligase A n=1 Tax=Thalassovita taeanensis TaxID=657014 RepID=A0A1H8ZEX7_9RHOB|nr:hypothetical protein [Thalassovita taeanensis]SEP62895.1 Lipoate-protein ligase A [Thalassovita taeanensis]
MRAEASVGSSLAVQMKRFCSAAEALRRQDYFQDSPFDPGQPALLIWQSPRALLASPEDARLPDFETVAQGSAEAGWPVAIRRGGGRLCPVSPGTLQFAISRPVSAGVTIETGYDEMAALLEGLLARFQLPVARGLCRGAFCPGRYDLAGAGRKVAGLAQAWRLHQGQRIVITGASLIVDEEAAGLADAVNRFYNAFQAAPACRPNAIGSLSQMADHPISVEDVMGVLGTMLWNDGAPPRATHRPIWMQAADPDTRFY